MFAFKDQTEQDSCYEAARWEGHAALNFKSVKIARMMIKAGDGNALEHLGILHKARDQAIYLAQEATQERQGNSLF